MDMVVWAYRTMKRGRRIDVSEKDDNCYGNCISRNLGIESRESAESGNSWRKPVKPLKKSSTIPFLVIITLDLDAPPGLGFQLEQRGRSLKPPWFFSQGHQYCLCKNQ